MFRKKHYFFGLSYIFVTRDTFLLEKSFRFDFLKFVLHILSRWISRGAAIGLWRCIPSGIQSTWQSMSGRTLNCRCWGNGLGKIGNWVCTLQLFTSFWFIVDKVGWKIDLHTTYASGSLVGILFWPSFHSSAFSERFQNSFMCSHNLTDSTPRCAQGKLIKN